MTRAMQIGVALALLLLVLTIFVSPAVDLLPSALRASHVVSLLWAVLACAAVVLALYLGPPRRERIRDASKRRLSLEAVRLIDLNCTRLC